MSTFDAVRALLEDVLQLGARAALLTPDSALLGSIPEFDSMALATVLTELEDRFGIVIADGDLSEEAFLTVGALTGLVEAKLAEALP